MRTITVENNNSQFVCACVREGERERGPPPYYIQFISRLTVRSCDAAKDCRFSAHCTTMCDESARKCTAELVRPNLHLGCRVLKEYLLYDVPDDGGVDLDAELRRLFARCEVLENKNDQVDVTPTLLLNEIKSLLWKRISNSANV